MSGLTFTPEQERDLDEAFRSLRRIPRMTRMRRAPTALVSTYRQLRRSNGIAVSLYASVVLCWCVVRA